MANIELADLDSGKFSISKGAVFYAPVWDFDSELELDFLGFTEGEVSVSFNETYQTLTLPEYTGDLPHEGFVQGEAPVVTIPLFTADPALRAILSPTGSASGGARRQKKVTEYTLVIFPEELFLSTDGQDNLSLEYDSVAEAWELDGVALTEEQERLLGQAVWIWRGHFSKPSLVYRHADAGKSVDEVTFTAMYQPLAPNGARAYVLGDPLEFDIDPNSGYVGESA
jgi:hypothetical protein